MTTNVNWRTAALLLPWERAMEELAGMGGCRGGVGSGGDLLARRCSIHYPPEDFHPIQPCAIPYSLTVLHLSYDGPFKLPGHTMSSGC